MEQLQLGKNFSLPLKNLAKHAIALGSSGSGKTVFTKILIEEAARYHVPSLIFDVQGDLCSLALFGTKKEREEKGLDENIFTQLKKELDVTIYTPVSSKGVSICINPLQLPKHSLPDEEAVTLIHDTATALTKLLGNTLRTSKGKYSQAVLYSALYYSYKNNITLGTFKQLITLLRVPPEDLRAELAEFFEEEKNLDYLIKQLKYLTIGQKKLLFQFGMPSSIGHFYKQHKEKTKLSLIYLNTLGSQEEKEYFVASMTNQVYQWMLDNPSETVQGLFVLDEIAPFIPAGSEKPVCKPILKLLFKQARKYGISCCIATQNPGDIDYKAFAQFGTWAIGRLSVKQDIKKVKQALKSLTSDIDLEATLPKLKTGEFLLYAPDSFENLKKFKTRWLYTQHKTLTEKDVATLMQTKVAEYKPLYVEDVEEDLPSYAEVVQTTPSSTETVAPQVTSATSVSAVTKDESWLKERALAKRTKKFIFFGPHTNQLLGFEKLYTPCYAVTVRVTKKGLFSDRIKDHVVLIHANTGQIIKQADKRRYFEESEKLFTLTQKELHLAKLLHITKEQYASEEELVAQTQLPKQTLTKTLHALEKKNIVSHETIGKFTRWFGILKIKQHKAKDFASTIHLQAQETKAFTAKIPAQDVRTFVQTWMHNASVAKLQLLELPYYKATYTKGKKTYTRYFDAITGKELTSDAL